MQTIAGFVFSRKRPSKQTSKQTQPADPEEPPCVPWSYPRLADRRCSAWPMSLSRSPARGRCRWRCGSPGANTPTSAAAMRAVVVSAFGGPEMLGVADVPEPQPGPGEVSVAVRFAGVNYTDVRNRQGDGLGQPPFIPGRHSPR